MLNLPLRTLVLLLLGSSLLAAPCWSQEEDDQEPPRGVKVLTDDASPGYTLIYPLNSKTVYLVDLAGEVVHEWPRLFALLAHDPGTPVDL